MNQFSELRDEDIGYLCDHLSPSDIREYFKKNPQPYQELKGSYKRPQKLTDQEAIALVFRNIQHPFVQSFLQKRVNIWLKQVYEDRDQLVENGLSPDAALLRSIPNSVFSGNSRMFFALSDEKEFGSDYIELFCCALDLLNQANEKTVVISESSQSKEEAQALADQILRLEREKEEERQNHETALNSLLRSEEENHKLASALKESRADLEKALEQIGELKPELDHYRRLDRYMDCAEEESSDNNGFVHKSLCRVCRVWHNSQWKTRLRRIADIIEGEIVPFIRDDNQPPYYENRDLLHWRDGPSEEDTLGIWNWTAEQNYSDSSRDYVLSAYDHHSVITQVVVLDQCRTVSDIVDYISKAFSLKSAAEKYLFACPETEGRLEGLLCRKGDFTIENEFARLNNSVPVLPHYSIRTSDLFYIGNTAYYRYLNFGIPRSIHRVRSPYAIIKELMYERARKTVFRAKGLSVKEAGRCQEFIKELPGETFIQQFSELYDCTEEEAQKYIDDFLSQCDSYLTETDFDVSVLTAAISRNPALIAVCKRELTDEWKQEYSSEIDQAERALTAIKAEADMHRGEIAALELKRQELDAALLESQKEIAQKEALASSVEEKIADRIRDARKNAADFISEMAFAMPRAFLCCTDGCSNEEAAYFFTRQIICEDGGPISDISDFEEYLAENLETVGYNELIAYDMAQGIAYCIGQNIPMVVGENAEPICDCIAAMFHSSPLTVSIPLELRARFRLYDQISRKCEEEYCVLSIAGVFDGFSSCVFQELLQQMRNWGGKAVILLPIAGLSVAMLPVQTWNHAVYLDGDIGLEGYAESPLQGYTSQLDFSLHPDQEDFKKRRKLFKPYQAFLGNAAIVNYARFCSARRVGDIRESLLIRLQIAVTACAKRDQKRLVKVFAEQGITNQDNKEIASFLGDISDE